MLGTVSPSGCSAAQPGSNVGCRIDREGGGDVRQQLKVAVNSESSFGQIKVEGPNTSRDGEKLLLAQAIKLVESSGEPPIKDASSTPYSRKELIAQRTSDPAFFSQVEAQNRELERLYEHLDTTSGVENLRVEGEISKLFGQALQQFAKDDGISIARKNLSMTLLGQDESPESGRRKKYASDELWRESVGLIRYVRGGDPVNTASLYRPSEKLESNTGVLELRPPGVAPSHLKGFFAQDVHLSITAWLDNYNRSSADPAYNHMSEEQRRNLERNVIGLREVQILTGSDLAAANVTIREGVFYDSNNNPATTEKHYTNEAGPGWATIVQSVEGQIYIFEHRRSELHHTTISGGKPVLYAGEIKLVEGRVAGLTSKTGHYKTGLDLIDKFTAYLDAQHVSHPVIRNYEHSSMIESSAINSSVRAGIIQLAMPRIEKAFEKDVLTQIKGGVDVNNILPFHVSEKLYEEWQASGKPALAWLNEYAKEPTLDADHAFIRKGVITNSVRYFLAPAEIQRAEVYLDVKGQLLYRESDLPVESTF